MRAPRRKGARAGRLTALASAARLAFGALGVMAACLRAGDARAQGPDPRRAWRTLETPHFRVHYADGLEAEGRRAAANAEWAWARLAAELVPPRGRVDLVVADNVDYTQGYATPTPTNRIVVFAQPPVEQFSLRFHDDWSRLVITHELTHIFHLDRARGVWGALRHILGRNPVLFPNAYSPAWVTEGLAVYYESRVTGTGRIAGTEHRVIARAAAAGGRLPRLDELSLASPTFPGGTQAYAYGSLAFDYLARTRGPEGVRAFVERASGQLIPYRLDRAARRSFGVSFSDAWAAWRDSVRRSVETPNGLAGAAPNGGGPAAWRELTREGWYAGYPRWLGDRSLVYAANDGRDVSGAYRVDEAGRRRLLGRRNSLSPNVPLEGGGLLFAQLEYVDPFTVRGDLWVQRDTGRAPRFGTAAGGQTRLTRGARLSHPDARGDGAIVAVQSGAGTTWLVRVSRDGAGARVAPLTRAARDTQWAEPRWSPDGRHVAAVALTPGARSSVVVLDTLGRVVRVVVSERAVNAAPSWSADGRRVVWSSDRTGAPQAHAADVRLDLPNDVPTPRVTRLSDLTAGLLQPVPSPARSGGGELAALVFRGDGYHLAVADSASLASAPSAADPTVYLPAAAGQPLVPNDAPSRPYRPWRLLVPRYWFPTLGESDGGSVTLGASTSAEDVVGRHAYAARATANVKNGDAEWSGTYRYAGLGQPSVSVGASQSWQYDTIPVRFLVGSANVPLFRRTRQVSTSFGLVRPRVRSGASLSLGASYERRAYVSPVAAVAALADDRIGRNFPALSVAGAYSNTRRPVRSVSPEDGVSLSASAQHRWQDGRLGPTSRRAVAAARAYKSLDLPGFAHHVLAVRAAAGVADARSASEFDAGGVSGSSAEIVPGFAVGDPSRTFGARGFAAGAQTGLRAAAATLEYRAPVTIAARGLKLLPLFFDRVSATAFADAASAWCPASIDRDVQTLCARSRALTPGRPRWLASVGAEVGLDAALDYDSPYRFRLGVAAPVAGRDRAARAVSVYFSLGTAF